MFPRPALPAIRSFSLSLKIQIGHAHVIEESAAKQSKEVQKMADFPLHSL